MPHEKGTKLGPYCKWKSSRRLMICLPKDDWDRLAEYQRFRGFATEKQTVENMIGQALDMLDEARRRVLNTLPT